MWDKRFTQGIPDRCWYGCGMACSKAADGHVVRTGPYKGDIVTVDGPEYENVGGLASNCGLFDPDWLLEVNFYCDTYGIDTISYGTACAFVMECWEKGILNAERTGGIDLTWGNGESEVELLHQMWRGEGFGVTVGKGVRYMQRLFIENGWGDAQFIRDIGMQIKGLEISQYMSKESLAQQGGYALANKGPQHDEAWLIFMDMVNNQIPTFEDKAEALHYFPLFRTWFGLQGLCKLPWNDIEPPDNHEKYPGPEAAKVPEHVDNYLALYTGITGKPLDRNEPDRAVGKGLQLPARVQPAHGPGRAGVRHAAVPRDGPRHEGRVRVARRALRRPAQGHRRRRPGREDHRGEDAAAPRVAHGPLQPARGRRLQAARLDAERRADDGDAEEVRDRFSGGGGSGTASPRLDTRRGSTRTGQ